MSNGIVVLAPQYGIESMIRLISNGRKGKAVVDASKPILYVYINRDTYSQCYYFILI